jgi:UDPglucose 6-dehydrogenase
MREAPSLVIIPMLQARGARVRAYDPQGITKAQDLLLGVEWCESALEAAESADVLVVLTEWNEFRALDLKRVHELMRGDVLVDLRNMYPEALASEVGFAYYGVGRTQSPYSNHRQPVPKDQHSTDERNGVSATPTLALKS